MQEELWFQTNAQLCARARIRLRKNIIGRIAGAGLPQINLTALHLMDLAVLSRVLKEVDSKAYSGMVAINGG